MDGSGNPYVTGETLSTNFPTKNPYQGAHGGGWYDAFVTKFGLPGPITATLTWNGQTEDEVRLVDGAGGLSPDGQADGSFALALDLGLGVSKDIASLVMTSTQHTGIEWNTIPGDGKSVLGVSTGGPLLNNPGDGSFTRSVTTTASFLLYGSDVPSSHPLYPLFPLEMYSYRVTMHFSDDSSAWAEAQIPPMRDVYLPIVLKSWTPGPTPTWTPTPTPSPTPTWTPTPTPTSLPPSARPYISDVDVNSGTNHVYVASTEWDRVFDIDARPSVRSVVDVIGVGDGPTGLAVLQPPNKVYVAHQYDWETGVSRIDANDNNARYDIGSVGAAPIRVAASPITMRVYVSNYYEKKTAVIDGVTDKFLYYIQRMEAAQGSYGIDVDPVTNRIFVATRDAGELVLIDGAAAHADPDGYIPVFIKPPQACSLYMVGVNPSKGHVFVTCPASGKVFVLDESLISPSQAQMMVTAEGWEKFVLPAEAGGWIKTIDVPSGTGAEGIAVNPITGRVYATNHIGNFVVVIQDSDNHANIGQLRTVSVGIEPRGVGVNTQTNRIYVGNSRSGNVSELDGNNDDKEILPRIPLPSP